MNKAAGTTEIDESLDVEIARSLHRSKGTAAPPHPASAEHEMAEKLAASFGRMTKLSMSEVDDLIDELHRLRKKLEADGDLIERAIAQHSEHSQSVMQLRRSLPTM